VISNIFINALQMFRVVGAVSGNANG